MPRWIHAGKGVYRHLDDQRLTTAQVTQDAHGKWWRTDFPDPHSDAEEISGPYRTAKEAKEAPHVSN